MDQFLTIYSEVAVEFFNDLKRRLEMRQHAVSDPYAAAAVTNDFLLQEIAHLRAQILDMDLRISQIVSSPKTAALLSAGSTLSMPKIYGAGSRIGLGDPVGTYGMYSVEPMKSGEFRWTGPTSQSGFIAHIDRSMPLRAKLKIVARISPDVYVTEVRVDGTEIKFDQIEDGDVEVTIPASPISEEAFFSPTMISFKLNRTMRVTDVNPASTDTRALGVGLQYLDLSAMDAD